MKYLLTNIKPKSDNLKINATDLSVKLICELCGILAKELKNDSYEIKKQISWIMV